MDVFAKRFAAVKNWGLVQFSTDLVVADLFNVDAFRQGPLPGLHTGVPMTEIFPEFVGSETVLANFAEGHDAPYELRDVNRMGPDGEVRYLDLTLLSGHPAGSGLLVIQDVTRRAVLQQTVNQQRYELLLLKSRSSGARHLGGEAILGNSPPIRQVRETIAKLGSVPQATVLLQGESGTGKNLVARVIHHRSMPPEAPFVDINCAALPENLMEAELFGYEKGAFTHATVSRAGLLEEAGGGTILLDEIGELPLTLQAKLLSALETKTFRRLGGNRQVKVKARIIAATNRNLQEEVAAKRFRGDLFYRLNVVAIHLRPLRELGEDVLAIADHLLAAFAREMNKPISGLSEKARKMLLQHDWPGNVRELSNCLERAVIFNDTGRIEADELAIGSGDAAAAADGWQVPPGGIALEDVERQLIQSALKQTANNKTRAARLLGLSRDTLRYRLEKFGIDS